MLLYFDGAHSRHVASSTIRLEMHRVYDSSDAVDDDKDIDNGFY